VEEVLPLRRAKGPGKPLKLWGKPR
jgi:hypothetical protein